MEAQTAEKGANSPIPPVTSSETQTEEIPDREAQNEIPQSNLDQQIHQYESTNEELKQAVPENIEVSLPDIPANASKEERLELLKKTNEILVDVVNAPETQPLKPRFGHGVLHEFLGAPFLMCSFHPSQQNTFTGKLTASMLREVFAEARRRIDAS